MVEFEIGKRRKERLSVALDAGKMARGVVFGITTVSKKHSGRRVTKGKIKLSKEQVLDLQELVSDLEIFMKD